ncbi:MAG: restriction endonuclease [Pseudomonadota bacterium]|nr:restriction endonuclease [Pseudomonadota bacterium]
MNDLLPWLIVAGLIWLAWKIYGGGKKASTSVVVQPVVSSRPQAQPKPQPRLIVNSPPKEDPQTRHLRNALTFAKTQHRELEKKQREHAAWERNYGLAQIHELDKLGGVEFEEYLAGLFRKRGFKVELTPCTGDYGADLLLIKNGTRIAVQAKRYAGSVGIAGVQEALSGMAYYKCNTAWVVTTGTFTPNAVELAKKSSVRLIGRADLGMMIAHRAETNGGAS